MTSTLAPEVDTSTTAAPTVRTNLWLGLALSALSGFLLVWSMEDFGVGGLIWFALVPGLVATHRVLPRRLSGFGIGIPIGMLFQGYLGPGLGDADLAWYLYIYGLWIGLFVALLAHRSRAFHRRTGYRWFLLSFPATYVALEYARTQLTEVFGGSWGMLAYAMYERPAFLQPVSVFGIHGMNMLILVVNMALAAAALAWLRQRDDDDATPAPSTAAATRGLAIVGAVILAWGVASVLMLEQPEPDVTVAAIQPDPYDRTKVADISQEEELRRNIEQTRFAAANGAELVVWHEAGLQMDLRDPDVQSPFARLSDELDIHLSIGWQVPTDDGRRLNEVATFGPDGSFLGTYGKSHPGEFAGDFSDRPGEYLTYETDFGTFGSIICFDLDFLDSARTVANLGAGILAVSSNDVQGIAEKHYTHLVFRAIENRLAVVKADSSWDSAIVDPWGRIIDVFASQATGRATLIAAVPVGTGDTFYARHGDWFAWLAAALALLAMADGLRRHVSRRRSTHPNRA